MKLKKEISLDFFIVITLVLLINRVSSLTGNNLAASLGLLNSFPALYGEIEFPSDPHTYAPIETYQFNITVNDMNGVNDISKVLFEFNSSGSTLGNTTATDYRTINTTAREYYTTKSNLIPGVYNWKWYANDSSGSYGNVVSESYTIIGNITDCSGGCIYVTNSTGNNVTIFDLGGNVDIKGSFSTTIGSPDGNDFIVKNSGGATVAWIDDVTGNFRITGVKSEDQGQACSPPANSFVMKNSTGDCVVYVDSSGNLWLKGRLAENAYIN